MADREDWIKHEVSHLEDMADNEALPLWLRVHYIALAGMRNDGHAHFEPGQLAQELSTNGAPVDRRNLQRAIKTAKERNVLSPESGTTCLVVPRDVAWRGKFKHSESTCTRHAKQVKAREAAQGVTSLSVVKSPRDDVTECVTVTSLSASPLTAGVGENGRPSMISSTTAPDSDTQPPAPPAVDPQQVHGQGLALDGENSQSHPVATTHTGETPTWQPKDHHHRQAEQLGFPVDMARVTSRFLTFHGHKHPAALDGLFTQWIAREKDTRPDWRKRRDAEREHAEQAWTQQANDNHDGDRDPVAVGSIIEHLPIGARQHIAAAQARRARREQALRTAARAQSA